MKNWFAALEPRERLILVLGVLFVLGALIYTTLWTPLGDGVQRLRAQLHRERHLVGYLDRASAEAKALRARAASAQARDTGRSLLSLLDEASKQAGIDSNVKRIQPQGQNQVRVWIDGAPFNNTLRWLDTLQRRYGIHVTSASIRRTDPPGQLSVQLTLSRNDAS